jgi:hypothetical protein
MTGKPNHAADQNDHRAVLELLPWYANGTLDVQEQARVKQHLATCRVCQQQLGRYLHLSTAAKSMDEKWSPSPRHFAQILAHIDRVEASRTKTAKNADTLLDRVRSWFVLTPRPMQWAIALQAALVLALAGGLVLERTGPAPAYETLSRPSEQAATSGAQLHVVFSQDVTGRELGDLLQSLDAQIVRGPSPMGVYTIQLPFDAVAQERMNQVLATLHAHPKVRLAEPVQGRSAQ